MPESGFSWPVIMRNSVVLPAPLGPMMPTMPPGGSLKDRPSIEQAVAIALRRESSMSMTIWPRRSPAESGSATVAGLAVLGALRPARHRRLMRALDFDWRARGDGLDPLALAR